MRLEIQISSHTREISNAQLLCAATLWMVHILKNHYYTTIAQCVLITDLGVYFIISKSHERTFVIS
jgi:hypothetical protein